MKNIGIGILFSILWSSASVATKFGVRSAAPLILANVRFFIAGILLLTFSYLLSNDKSYRLPNKKEWKQLALFGFLNTTLYLGLYVYAMKFTAAGIGSLAVSTNPLIIVLLSSWWLKRRPRSEEWLGILLGMAGVGIATYPLLADSYTTVEGVSILLISMIAVSAASVYYATIQWELPNLLINGWQVFLGGVFLLPATAMFADFSTTVWDATFWFPVLWLSLAVSIVGLICWFHLLRIDTVRASLWLFLCPLFGFFFAWWLMDEPVTIYTVIGTVFVVAGLYAGQRGRSNE
ncbi:EamA family transporter [Dyadobacter sp. LJ53]|uniref:DMT family transporter n=1 Tax=Dyadobacter chenwenxiniae TaxID=2906456 RepID=UPI001F262226|nr:EamA family transporter [Dyadobacter chenwenxiniae]MCF0049837.1 EamA family transporter [Dyadobacter chenwenxiniae]MCF0049915.1 EamA family transporter [Dyadobacter chenwenxiniae]